MRFIYYTNNISLSLLLHVLFIIITIISKVVTVSSFLIKHQQYNSNNNVLIPFSRRKQESVITRNVVFTKLSEDCLLSMSTAQQEAIKLKLSEVNDSCLLYGISTHSNIIANTLLNFGITPLKIQDTLGYTLSSSYTLSSYVPKLSDFDTNNEKTELPFGAKCQQTLFTAGTISKKMGCNEIQPEHIFLASMYYKETDNGEVQAATRSDDCEAMEILYNIDARLEGEDLCTLLLQNLMEQQKHNQQQSSTSGTSSSSSSDKSTQQQKATTNSGVGVKQEKDRASSRSLLAECGTDLTEEAKDGTIDKIHGRNNEIQACFQTLVRRRKNNVILIGEAGVGKTAIVNGIANILVSDDCPAFLHNTRIISLEISSLISGTTYRGEFESKLRDIIEELISSRKRTILFLDDIHQIVGAGATGDSSIDASNILKPYLSSSSRLQVIGATTVSDYNKHIAKDAALERRFQPIYVREPTVDETVDILHAILPFYRSHHRVEFTNESLVAAARLSDRFIHDRFLPDKAIDVLDEAGALANLKRTPNALEAPEVTEGNVTDLISQWTNIPVGKLELDELGRLQSLEEGLAIRVKGQKRAVTTVAKAIRRARTGIRNPRRPIASFLFCGPTGTGKTELCKTLADTYFGSERDLIRIDMSEYMEKSAVARLTGPPPGFVGYEDGGQLTEAVRRAPHSVVLLDELEKAHGDVLNILLQILEDGVLTDGKGRQVSFKNTVIIMTSNIGSQKILELTSNNQNPDYRQLASIVFNELDKVMKPEFLNRIDDIVVFEPLTETELSMIATTMVIDIAQRAHLERGLNITVSGGLLEKMVKEGSTTANRFGARPMRRAVQRILEDTISDAVVQGFLREGDSAVFDALQDDDGNNDDVYSVIVSRDRDNETLSFVVEQSSRDFVNPLLLVEEDNEDEVDDTDDETTNGFTNQEYLVASSEQGI